MPRGCPDKAREKEGIGDQVMPKPIKVSKLRRHINTWRKCEDCALSQTRKTVVLIRGQMPCDVLFVGEAPGPSEDVLGKPFVGPAGLLLDNMISWAVGDSGCDPAVAFTNVVACIPKEDVNSKFVEPPLESKEACLPRLVEIIEISKAKEVIAVGEIAYKWLKKNGHPQCRKIPHPAAILRADITQRGLLVQSTQVTIAEIFRAIYRRYNDVEGCPF